MGKQLSSGEVGQPLPVGSDLVQVDGVEPRAHEPVDSGDDRSGIDSAHHRVVDGISFGSRALNRALRKELIGRRMRRTGCI